MHRRGVGRQQVSDPLMDEAVGMQEQIVVHVVQTPMGLDELMTRSSSARLS